MLKKLLPILAIIAIAILISAVACDRDKGTGKVSFKVPGSYTGSYQFIFGWGDPDPSIYKEHLDSISIEFSSSNTFVLDVDTSKLARDICCDIKGTYRFTGDSLFLTMTSNSSGWDPCAPDHSAQGGFTHYIDGDFLVFEIRNTVEHTYKKIELIAN